MGTNEFKYSEFMSELETLCPPIGFKPRETIAFRWVFDTMEDEKNFQPQYLKMPARFQDFPPDVKCQSLGLSFFSTGQAAMTRFQVLTARMSQDVKNKIGKALAEGTILEKDGVSDLPDEKGHFTLHPYVETDFAKQFKILGGLENFPNQ